MSRTLDDRRGLRLANDASLWLGSGLAALCVHIGAVAWALHERPVSAADSPPPAIMIELAPTPEAVETQETNIAPDKTASQAVESETTEPVKEPEPEPAEPEPARETMEPHPDTPVEEPDPVEPEIVAPLRPVETKAEVILPEPPKKKPVERPRKKVERPKPRKPPPRSRQADQAQAQVTASSRNAASAAASGSGASMSPANWKSQLMAHLERRKQYPSGARARGETGIAYVRFSLDAGGNVLSASLARSSGFPELDAEVVSLVRRASPVPAPPVGVSRTITAPVRFSVR